MNNRESKIDKIAEEQYLRMDTGEMEKIVLEYLVECHANKSDEEIDKLYTQFVGKRWPY